jgi:hypothetical protein
MIIKYEHTKEEILTKWSCHDSDLEAEKKEEVYLCSFNLLALKGKMTGLL